MKISVKKCRKDGLGIFKGMSPFTAEDELKTLEQVPDDAWAWIE